MIDAMKQNSMTGVEENRAPREKFTKTLTRICARLDVQATFDIEDNDELSRRLVASGHMTREQVRERVEIATLWVVGSYARGALTCGDLDIVIQNASHRRTGAPGPLPTPAETCVWPCPASSCL